MSKSKISKPPSGAAWAQERAKRKGGSNIRGNTKEDWERSKVKGHYRDERWVKSYYRHKGKR